MKTILLPTFLLFFLLQIQSLTLWAQNTNTLKTPNISANALFLYRNSNFHKEDTDTSAPGFEPDHERNGLGLQEAEIYFYSDVDPYTKLSLMLAVHPEYELDGSEVKEHWLLEPEEAFAESIFLPNISFKIGKFKASFGKHNAEHTHSKNFIQNSLTSEALLGEHGFNDIGLSTAILLPTSWFSELTLQYLRGEGENSFFNSATPGDGVLVSQFKNVIDTSENSTIELGLSAAQGANSLKGNTSFSGAHIIYKWSKQESGIYSGLTLGSEYISRTQTQSAGLDEKASGLDSYVRYQLSPRWFALARSETFQIENSLNSTDLPDDNYNRNSLGIIFKPSEFSSYRAEYGQRKGGNVNSDGEDTEKTLLLRADFSIGSHPSHTY